METLPRFIRLLLFPDDLHPLPTQVSLMVFAIGSRNYQTGSY